MTSTKSVTNLLIFFSHLGSLLISISLFQYKKTLLILYFQLKKHEKKINRHE